MTIVEWPSEKKNPTVVGRWPSCINRRVDIVDGGDVVGIERMGEPERVGNARRTDEQRVMMKHQQREAAR